MCTILLLLFTTFLLAQPRRGIIPIKDNRLFKVVLEINEDNVLSRSNEYFRMQAVKVISDERVSDDEEIQAFKSFYYCLLYTSPSPRD